ncbi:hypothetical protein CDL15_Pgr002450 [Punica granatum]|uniref:VAL1-3 N-terminal zinc finger domain-containing protein n=1 Tax=Punica granatum TaxID=22663 RepID=A0A218XUN6_PUNGR|nr:hypothetical protein CDL15_Pgr002450 [Punica granatum]
MAMNMKSAMNKEICLYCRREAPNLRKGWQLVCSGFAQLCDECAAIYESGRFCEVFHGESKGWKECEKCDKMLHCGCIMSQHKLVMLDSGGVSCMECFGEADEPPSPPLSDVSLESWKNPDDPTAVGEPATSMEVVYGAELGVDHIETLGSAIPVESSAEVVSELGADQMEALGTTMPSTSSAEVISGVELGAVQIETLGSRAPSESVSETNLQVLGHEAPSDAQNAVPESLQNARVEDSSERRKLEPKIKAGADEPGHWDPLCLAKLMGEKLQEVVLDHTYSPNAAIIPLFEKLLTLSDADPGLGELMLPHEYVEAYFPKVPDPNGLPVKVQDMKGNNWDFCLHSKSCISDEAPYALQGTKDCILSMQWEAGDTAPEIKCIWYLEFRSSPARRW